MSSATSRSQGPTIRSPPRSLEGAPDSAHPDGFEKRIPSLIDSSDTPQAVTAHSHKYGKHLNSILGPPKKHSEKAPVPPQPSPQLPQGYASAEQQLQPIFEEHVRHAEIFHVSPECFDLLKQLEGWERLRLDYDPRTEVLNVNLPLFPHDMLSRITGTLSRQRDNSQADAPPADEGGTTTIQLADGSAKSADFIWLDPKFVPKNLGKSHLHSASSNSYPTIVLEVALSERVHKLSMDCARWMLCTLGKVRTALGMKIEAGSNNRELKTISVRQWRLLDYIPHDPAARQYDRMLRPIILDDNDKDKSESEHGEDTAFAFTLDMGDKVSTWKTASTLTKIYGDNVPKPYKGGITIRNWQIYRSGTPEEDAKVYAELPYEDMIASVKNAFDHQTDGDFVTDVASKKRDYSALEIEDTIEASQLNLMKARQYAKLGKSQKTDTNQEAGPSQRSRARVARESSRQQKKGGQSSSSSRR